MRTHTNDAYMNLIISTHETLVIPTNPAIIHSWRIAISLSQLNHLNYAGDVKSSLHSLIRTQINLISGQFAVKNSNTNYRINIKSYKFIFHRIALQFNDQI